MALHAWPRFSTCAPHLCCARVPSRVAQHIPLRVRPGAAGGLACAGVQVRLLALGVAPLRPAVTPPLRAQPSLHPLRHGPVLPLGVEPHLKIEVTQAFNPPLPWYPVWSISSHATGLTT